MEAVDTGALKRVADEEEEPQKAGGVKKGRVSFRERWGLTGELSHSEGSGSSPVFPQLSPNEWLYLRGDVSSPDGSTRGGRRKGVRMGENEMSYFYRSCGFVLLCSPHLLFLPMQVSLSIVSLNVRSMRSASRLRMVLAYLENLKADIIFLQECALPFRASYREWERRCPHGPSVWSGSNENRADGVAVLVHNKGVEVVGHTVVKPGRAALVSFCFGGVVFRAINVYAPVVRQDRFEGGVVGKKIKLKVSL